MRKLSIYTSAVVLVLATLLYAAGCSGAVRPEEGSEYTVTGVIDGDTIRLSGIGDVRYIGIDAPETMKRVGSGWAFQPEQYGVAAKEFNSSMVSGRDVRLEFDREKRDKYGRLLAYIYVEDKMVNLELVRRGLATVYTFPPNIRHFNVLIEAQEEAKSGKKGLWGEVRKISAQNAENYIGAFCEVTGMVVGIGSSKSRIYLNFGKERGRSLAAVINRSNLSLFKAEGIDPKADFRGKLVRVTGKIEDQGGPVIIVDNPSQISLL